MSEEQRLLSRAEIESLIRKTIGFVNSDDPRTNVTVLGWWNAELKWARNRVSISGERRDVTIRVSRRIEGSFGEAHTNQIDDVSLMSVVKAAERATYVNPRQEISPFPLQSPNLPRPDAAIWSDVTADITTRQRADVAHQFTSEALSTSRVSSGYIEMRAGEIATCIYEPDKPIKIQYDTYTQSQCSVTVRDLQKKASGWAGLSSYDWAAINSSKLVKLATDKCVASLDPVALEPGRYMTILEPQAVVSLCDPLIASFDRVEGENGASPWWLGMDTALRLPKSKLGLRVIDERITISHAPAHPLLGVLPVEGLAPVSWIRNGVLSSLIYNRSYALSRLNENDPVLSRNAYEISGGNVSMEQMIESTPRGLIVTRFSGVSKIDGISLLCSGFTRDGLWLVENGKISKAVRNFRFTESPLFMLNQVISVGPSVPVFRPITDPYRPGVSPAIVPALQVNDFSFTSTIDAI